MAFSLVVTSIGLTKNKVVRSEDLANRTGSNAVDGSRLKVHENSTRDESATTGFIVVNIDSLKLI